MVDNTEKASSVLDLVIKGAKAAILVAIALFFVRCSVGAFVPDVNISGLEDVDEISIEVTEEEGREVVVIKKNGESVIIADEGK